MMKFFSYLANNSVFVFIFTFFAALFLAILAWFFLPIYFSLGICTIIAIGIAIIISYRKDIPIPLIRIVLKREYYRIKFKYHSPKIYADLKDGGDKKKQPMFIRVYLEILYYFILLFKSSQDSFEDLKEDNYDLPRSLHSPSLSLPTGRQAAGRERGGVR